jgi:uncharacterized iron-regulated membrane protein
MNVRKVHIYLGLVLAIPILITVMTGMVLGFHDSIQFSSFPYQVSGDTRELFVASETLIQKIQKLGQTESIEAIHLSTDRNHAVRVKGKTQVFFLHPITGDVLATQSGTHPEGIEWVLKVHRGTWITYESRIYASFLGVFLFLFWPTGWWMRRVRTKNQKKKTPIQMKQFKNAFGLHRWFGFFTGLLVSAMGLSGALMNYNNDLMRWLDPAPQPSQEQIHVSHSDPLDSLSQIISTSQNERPNSVVRSIYFRKPAAPLTLVYFTDNSRVYLNTDTQSVEKKMTPTSHWIHLLYPLHSGKAFGKLHWLIPIVIGLLAFVITFAGILASPWVRSRIRISRT